MKCLSQIYVLFYTFFDFFYQQNNWYSVCLRFLPSMHIHMILDLMTFSKTLTAYITFVFFLTVRSGQVLANDVNITMDIENFWTEGYAGQIPNSGHELAIYVCPMTMVKSCWHNFTQSACFMIFPVSSISYRITILTQELYFLARSYSLPGIYFPKKK